MESVLRRADKLVMGTFKALMVVSEDGKAHKVPVIGRAAETAAACGCRVGTPTRSSFLKTHENQVNGYYAKSEEENDPNHAG